MIDTCATSPSTIVSSSPIIQEQKTEVVDSKTEEHKPRRIADQTEMALAMMEITSRVDWHTKKQSSTRQVDYNVCKADALYRTGKSYLLGTNGEEQNIGEAAAYFQAAVLVAAKHNEGKEEDSIHKKPGKKISHRAAARALKNCRRFARKLQVDISKSIESCQRVAGSSAIAAIFGESEIRRVAEAMVDLGICYINGIGVEIDLKKAAILFKEAAVKGNIDAMYFLGICYEYGTGVTKDIAKAVDLYRQAAERRHGKALVNLGGFYMNGSAEAGIKENPVKAFDCFQKAADRGHAAAWFNLAICYKQSIGVDESMAKSVDCFKKAADLGMK